MLGNPAKDFWSAAMFDLDPWYISQPNQDSRRPTPLKSLFATTCVARGRKVDGRDRADMEYAVLFWGIVS